MAVNTNPELESSSRRSFLKTCSFAAGVAACATFSGPAIADAEGSLVQVSDLPMGTAPQPLDFRHFPSRLHAFVWRNWPLVTTDRMATVVGTEPAEILRIGHAMGLVGPPRITREQQARSYVTIIKRNWHLLPYDQLLELLDWSAERMAFTLREDDVLYWKLGALKPACTPLHFTRADDSILRREEEIARIVQSEFPSVAGENDEPLFDFVAQLAAAPTEHLRPKPPAADSLRFCFSYFALTGDPLLEEEADPYPDGFLARLAQSGVNGVWLQTPFYKLAPFPWDPARSLHHEKRLQNLRLLVARAQKHGIQLFLYINEPRALPLSFYDKHPHLKGVVEGDHAALCTSVPEVREYLVNAVEFVSRAVPDLGGFFSITFSENLTHCWSHRGGAGCPRCSQRKPGEVVSDLNPLFWKGIQQSGTRMRLLAWDWVWDDDWAPDVIQTLPPGVELMSVSEWSLPIERGGVKSKVGEYAISAIGPGPRALEHWRLARERGLKTIAKIQAGNTWELSAVPYIPAVENVARHVENLRAEKVDGLMLGWSLGGYPSPNLEVVSEVMGGLSAEEAMLRVAENRFGHSLAPKVVSAWKGYSAAFSEFPYHITVLYYAPQQLGPANPLWDEPTGYKASMVGFPYDDLEGWLTSYQDEGRTVYSPEKFIAQFEKVADGFDQTLEKIKDALAQLDGTTDAQRKALELECGVAEVCGIHFRSCANQARFILARRGLAAAAEKEEAEQYRDTMERTLKDEITLARRLFAIQMGDSRIGFEASNQYNYVPIDLVEKVINCRELLDRLSQV